MTDEKKESITKSVPVWLTAANFIFLASLSFQAGSIRTEMAKDISRNKELLEAHTNNIEVHMPYQQKVQLFVPRQEIEYKFKDIKEDLSDIKDALNIKEK